jgi:hypothetical protein
MRLLPLSLVITAVIVSATFALVFELSIFVDFLQRPHSGFNYYHPLWAFGVLFGLWAYDPKLLMVFEPALLVHSWMLLFFCGAGLLRLSYPFFKAVSAAQWFLKAGGEHPLRAIGMVSAALTFILVAGFKAFW